MTAEKTEWETKRTQITQILETINNDTGTPRNIRRTAKQASDMLYDEKLKPAVRAANSIELLEEIVNDPNMPMHSRTLLWSAISQLETIRAVK